VALELDPEILQAVMAMLGSGYELPGPTVRDDWKALRAKGETALAGIEATLPEHRQVSRADYEARSAAPARALDLAGLAPAYVEVGELDIFRDEAIEYARRLSGAGVSAELHVRPGCPHGFDRAAPAADVTRRSRADRLRVLASI
jgi:acetyl esterase/lipase